MPEGSLAENDGLSLSDLAYNLYLENFPKETLNRPDVTSGLGSGLAIVAESIGELKSKIASAKVLLKENAEFIPARQPAAPPAESCRAGKLAGNQTAGGRDTKGIYFSSKPMAKDGKVAFLFSGQGLGSGPRSAVTGELGNSGVHQPHAVRQFAYPPVMGCPTLPTSASSWRQSFGAHRAGSGPRSR